jgi:hypothetical protein
MKSYKLEIFFTNLDNSLYTSEEASMTMDIKADNYAHAVMLALRTMKVFDADHYDLEEVK